MKIRIILASKGGDLDNQIIEVPDGDDDMTETSNAIHEAIECWILSVGDIIEIREV